MLLALQGAPGHEQAWAAGAAGEEAVAESLARRCPSVPILHDRRIPGSRTNIDHLAIAATGVYVIDAKSYRGKIEVQKPIFGAPRLLIAGRDKTKLTLSLAKQVEAVRSALAGVGSNAPVHGCFCFVPPNRTADNGLPLFRTLEIDGFRLCYPRKLAKRLNGDGSSLSPAQAEGLAVKLASLLPPA